MASLREKNARQYRRLANNARKRRAFTYHPILDEVARHPRLPADVIHALARRVKAGMDPGTGTLNADATEARNAIASANLGLAVQYLKRYRPATLDYDEAMSAALLGVLRAAETYDPDLLKADGKPHAFATHAYYWMRSRVGEAAERTPLVPTPRYSAADVARLSRLVQDGRFPTPTLADTARLASVLGCSPKHAAAVLDGYWCRQAVHHGRSILRRDDGSGEGHETDPADYREPDHAARLDDAEQRDRLRAAMVNLTEIERAVLCHRYEFDGAEYLPFSALAARTGLSRWGLQKAESRAVRKLLVALRGEGDGGGEAGEKIREPGREFVLLQIGWGL
jgi:RNA polymerase sigma factor (sigma-70 family)